MFHTLQLFLRNLSGYLYSFILNLIFIIHCTIKLLTLFGIGYTKWITAAGRLILFGMILLPAWWKLLFPYAFSSKILRGIPYGVNLRNVLDIYLPVPFNSFSASSPPSYPVAVLVWGGAWTIGYKLWPFILAQKLSQYGILCVVLDYRNFPQGNVIHMVEDINNAMNWTFNNVSRYGGNPANVYLVGQSAGAHLTMLSLLQQTKAGDAALWQYSQLKHFVGISGAYDLVSLKPILDKHGLAEVLFRAIMDQDIVSNSPIDYLKQNFGNQVNNSIDKSPPITLIHGTKDKTVASDFTLAFAEELNQLKFKVKTKIFEGKSHTDFFLEDMIEGNGESFVDFLCSIILQKDINSSNDNHINILDKPYCNPLLVKLARIVNPF